MSIIVTGGLGFIGSNFILSWFAQSDESIINIDKQTYAANIHNLSSMDNSQGYLFKKGSIDDRELLGAVLREHRPRAIIHFAAETHVDRSIHSPETFMKTNIIGTFELLDTVRSYWNELSESKKANFRFLHISTDEVYGSLMPDESAFTENSSYQPNSPYSASKASSDHIVRAYHHTYGLPVLTTNCSNNYGPYQFPEKLIPLIIHNALAHKPLPIYGDGLQIRDWLYVDDHCSAIRTVLAKGSIGEVYNIGGLNEKANIDIVYTLCDILDEMRPIAAEASISSYRELITHVTDRPGHDRRYAIDATKIETELDWRPSETFQTGIRKTVAWYLNNQVWVEQIISGEYHQWIEKQYA